MSVDDIRTRRSYCRVCTAQCGILVDVAGDTVIRVRGDRDHPLTRGYTCPKGRALPRLHHHPEAITQPLMRVRGGLAPARWDACLDDLATRLRATIDAFGPGSVGIYYGSGLGMDAAGYRMIETMQRAIGTPARFSPLTIDGTAKVLVASAVGGFPGMATRADFDHARLVLMIGLNPMVSHGHNTGMFDPARILRALAARGALWVIDPLRTETARHATRHIAPLPGRDYAILAWLVREVLRDGPLTPAQPLRGIDELRSLLQDHDRARAAELSGVSEQELEDLLAAVRKAGCLAIETGTGVTMSAGANLTQWFAYVLLALTGSMNRRGGVWFHPGFLNPFERLALPVFDEPWTPGPPSRPELSGIIGEWPCAALPDEIATGNIRALLNFGGSLIRSFPDANVLEPALRALEVHAAFDIVANETTALATHVLPTRDQLERPDVSLWDTLGARVALQHTCAAVRPLGERRSAWWLIAQLMDRLGFALPPHLPGDDREAGADEAVLASLLADARCDYATVAATGYVEFPLQFPSPWVDEHVARMGGWRLLAHWQAVRGSDDAAKDTARRALRFVPRRQRRKLNAQLDFLGAPADVILHPEDALAAGVLDGELVRVGNAQGAICLVARIDPAIRSGVVSIPHGHAGANVNALTSKDAVDRLTGMALYSGIEVSITRA